MYVITMGMSIVCVWFAYTCTHNTLGILCEIPVYGVLYTYPIHTVGEKSKCGIDFSFLSYLCHFHLTSFLCHTLAFTHHIICTTSRSSLHNLVPTILAKTHQK
ncbi:hypothetical protein EON63_19260 [archaeon]|nr:MAG: hypothetical protein EON63_19260 [archaeon]